MANERKKAKKAKLKENKDRLVLYHTANNNVESAASESSRGESFDSGYREIIQEENLTATCFYIQCFQFLLS